MMSSEASERVAGLRTASWRRRWCRGPPAHRSPGRTKKVRKRKPELLVERAVRGMLPHNSLGRKLFRKLKVYAGPEHPHAAQKPEVLQLG